MTMASVAENEAWSVRPRTEVSEHESLQLTRNLLRIAMSNISYVRGFFPESYYREKYVPALEMKVNKLLPMDLESKRFIDWTEKGVFDALQKKYLRTLSLTICLGEDGPSIEEYTFSFKYAADGASKNITSMIIESSSGGPVHTETNNQASRLQMKQSACKMVRTLVQLMYTLDDVPKERTISMRLHYYDDITPENYEPPFFESSADEDSNPWDHEPLKMEVGHVDGKQYKLAIQVKSVLDPCDNGNDMTGNKTCSSGVSLTSDDDSLTCSDDSLTCDDDSPTTSEAVVVNTLSSQLCCQPNQPCRSIQKILPQVVTSIQASENKEQIQGSFEESVLLDTPKPTPSTAGAANKDATDKTIQPVFEAKNKPRSCRLRKREKIEADVTDIADDTLQLSKIDPGCQDCQGEVASWSNATQQYYEVEKRSPLTNSRKNMISEAEKVPDDLVAKGVQQSLYEKALLHTLPRDYITIRQLGEALVDVHPAKTKKLMSQMGRDGYVEITASVRRKGRQVFHHPEAEMKLQSLRAVFDSKIREDKETEVSKCDREPSQPRVAPDLSIETCSILPNIQRKGLCKTRDELAHGRTQALDTDIPGQGILMQHEHSKAYINTEAIIPFQESPQPQNAMQEFGLQRQVSQTKELINGLEDGVVFLGETETETQNAEKIIGRLQKELNEKNEEVKRLRQRTATQESGLSEKTEDSVEIAKTSAIPGELNENPSLWRFRRKRVRFQDSDSLEDIYVDCTLRLKAKKVNDSVDGAVNPSLFERAREEKFANKENHDTAEDDPYDFKLDGRDKSFERKFRGNSTSHHASTGSPKKRQKTNTYNNSDSIHKSDKQAETLKSLEKTWPSFLQGGTALKKCPRPEVYVRRSRRA